ncbi:hypothetical protein IQ238_19775 [Pleurocapsales cyanobacterium LEGE 06147]|nr:hypothetical protein [Pleurocapsales cyanobacterium LEGE 06147]
MISLVTAPKFHKDQQVTFIGGSGKIEDCFLDSGTWVYLVKMELDTEPEMGRIGYETTLLLHQTEIRQVIY